ncbi:discoidin domain-containing protein, partial [Streptomyces ipomoeae]
PPRHVNDGSAATRWMPLDSDTEPWVAVDLERLVTVRQVILTFTGEGDRGFVVESSRDRTTWAVMADHSHPPTDAAPGTWRIDVPEVVALQIRVRLLPGGETPCGVSELSALGRL